MFDFLAPDALIQTLGLAGVIGIIFAESGLFFGFFLPGDSLLFTAGFLASQGHLPLPLLLVGCFLAAVAGDSVGYAFGRQVGPRIFIREESFFFHRAHLERTKRFYARHGRRTIILARFVPVVRTFAPILAGVGEMPYREFLRYNIIGGLVWSVGFVLLGFLGGRLIPGVDRYLLPIVIVIIVTSFVPLIKQLRQRQ